MGKESTDEHRQKASVTGEKMTNDRTCSEKEQDKNTKERQDERESKNSRDRKRRGVEDKGGN